MPRITDPALLQMLGTPSQGAAPSSFANNGLKPPEGYHRLSPTALAPDTGGPKDMGVIATQAATEAAARARASTPIEVQGQIQAAAARAQIENSSHLVQLEQAQRMAPKLTPDVRKEAIAGYRSATLLDQQIKDIENLYKQGPGSTKGISGLRDFNPFSTINGRFNDAGDAVRGNVGTALGFTGGQLNTPREAEAAVGPYLPHAGDKDERILDKINRLKQLRDNARDRAVAQLGGVPDESGNITPVSQAKDTQLPGLAASNGAGTPPPSGGTPLGALATGATRNDVSDPTLKLVTGLIRQGLSADQINAVLKESNLGSVKPEDIANAQATLKAGGSIAATQEVPNSALTRASSSWLGAYGINAGNMILGGNLDSLTSDPAQARAGMAAVQEAHPGWSTVGSVTGGALAAAGSEFGLAGLGGRMGGVAGRILSSPRTADAAYGAFAGAGENDEDRLTGAVTGGLAGLAGGMFGRGLMRGAGNVTRGIRNDATQYLRERNIPLTVGQAVSQSGTLGSIVKGAEERLSGLPGVGALVNRRYREGLEGLSREGFDQGLAPIGATTNGLIGEAGVDAARTARSQAYRDTLDPVRLNADQPFVGDMSGALQAGRALPDPMRGNIDYTLNTRVGNSFDSNGGLTGNDFQQSIRGLRRDTRAVRDLPYGHDFGQVAGQAEGALEGLLDRQAPGVLPAYRAANTANRNVEVLRSAVDKAKANEGVFTPYQLAQAASQNAKQFGNTHGTTDQPFYDLTRAAMNVLPNKTPDSGTAGRLATFALPGVLAGGGAAGGAAMGDTAEGTKYGLGAAALAGLGGSRAGQRMLTTALLDRPETLVRIGDQIYNRTQLGGMFGAGAGSLLPFFTQ